MQYRIHTSEKFSTIQHCHTLTLSKYLTDVKTEYILLNIVTHLEMVVQSYSNVIAYFYSYDYSRKMFLLPNTSS